MSESESRSVKSASGAGLLFRLYWMAFGNIPIIFLPILIIRNTNGNFSFYDILFSVSVSAIIAVRYVDIRYFNGETADNQPATLSLFKKYALKVFAFAAAALVVSHAAALLLAS